MTQKSVYFGTFYDRLGHFMGHLFKPFYDQTDDSTLPKNNGQSQRNMFLKHSKRRHISETDIIYI